MFASAAEHPVGYQHIGFRAGTLGAVAGYNGIPAAAEGVDSVGIKIGGVGAVTVALVVVEANATAKFSLLLPQLWDWLGGLPG